MNVGHGGALTALVLLMTMGCGGSDSAVSPNEDGGSENESGNGNVVEMTPDGGATDAPPPAVGGAPPTGIFVSASKGTVGADGAMTRPVKTIAEGLALAVKQHLPVNVCAEAYTESVTLADGITMFGYYDCSNLEKWSRGQSNATITSPTSPAVIGENLLLPATFAGFDVQAPDIPGQAASGPAASSYGMILRSSKNLTISDSSIRAGKGQDGLDGAEPTNNEETSNEADGKPAEEPLQQNCRFSGMLYFCNFATPLPNLPPAASAGGSEGGKSKCKVGPNGGAGGWGGAGRITANGSYRVGYNSADAHGLPITENAETAAGGSWFGANGPPGAPGTNGTHGSWSFKNATFVPGDGTAGENGRPGKGGGGGGGTQNYRKGDLDLIPNPGTWRSGTGGGGGAGGCGGTAGKAGKGGGASIGLLVVDSEDVTITMSRIEAKEGGAAGKGTRGTLGTPGRPGGAGAPSSRAGGPGGPGGQGGAGGSGGLSGHGAPGPSISLVFRGARPKTSYIELVVGIPGEGAPALTQGAQSLPAVSGVAKQEHAL